MRSPHGRYLGLVLIVAVLAVGCSSSDGSEEGAAPDTSVGGTSETTAETGVEAVFALESSAFDEGDPLPDRFAFSNENLSPPLSWEGVPAETELLAITVVDPDAANFVHWVLVGIEPTLLELDEGAVPVDTVEGLNNFNELGWGGPAPPAGEPHSYIFTIHALSGDPAVDASTNPGDAIGAIDEVTIARAELRGQFTSG